VTGPWQSQRRGFKILDMFGIGVPELVMLGLVTMVVLGATRLPAGAQARRRRPELSRSRRWSWADWALVGAVVLLGLIALVLALART
jgi:hypothetical protein